MSRNDIEDQSYSLGAWSLRPRGSNDASLQSWVGAATFRTALPGGTPAAVTMCAWGGPSHSPGVVWLDVDIEMNDLFRDFFLGFVKIHVLQHASREPVYGLAMIDELRRHGYQLGPGSLYPLLHGLEEAGLLGREDRIVAGRVRKYYVITALGTEALAEARERVRELVEEVVEGVGPDHLAEPSNIDDDDFPTGEGQERPAQASR